MTINDNESIGSTTETIVEKDYFTKAEVIELLKANQEGIFKKMVQTVPQVASNAVNQTVDKMESYLKMLRGE